MNRKNRSHGQNRLFLGRSCGSIFSSTIVELLINDDKQAGNAAPFDHKTFTEDIRAKILKLASFNQETSSSAQESKWSDEYHDRTGIPASEYKVRLNVLRTLPNTSNKDHPYGNIASDTQLQEWGQSNLWRDDRVLGFLYEHQTPRWW
jgi:hypothetical protein